MSASSGGEMLTSGMRRSREDGEKAFATAMASAEGRVAAVRDEYEARLRKARELQESDGASLTAMYEARLRALHRSATSANP